MELITLEQVVKVADDLVSEVGVDHTARRVYRGWEGEPICIVGNITARLTPEVYEGLREYSSISPHSGGSEVRHNALLVRTAYTADAIDFMSAVQEVQDNDETWATAVMVAKEQMDV